MENNKEIRYSDEQVLFCYSSRNLRNIKEDSFLPHSHDICELLFFINGDVSYSTRGYKYNLQPYDLIISRPSEIHRIEIMRDCTSERKGSEAGLDP